MLRRSISLASVATFVVLSYAALVSQPLNAGDIILEEEITYGKGGERDLQLDLARPADGNGPFPAIVFVHGGGWRGGARQGYHKLVRAAAERGYVAVTVTYRLTEPDDNGKATNPFPAAIHDTKCAVRWVRANAERYKIDPDRIGVTGGSAGGHLSLLIGLADEKAGLEGTGGHSDVSSRVQAVVNYFGPTQMIRLARSNGGAGPIVESFLGGKPEELQKAYRKSSPVTHLSDDDPPILTIHGAQDTLVPPSQAQILDRQAKEKGVEHTLMLLEGQGHGFRGEASEQANEAMFAFFDKHLKGE